jgi:enoyl-[acyl-carrier protein] reductase I
VAVTGHGQLPQQALVGDCNEAVIFLPLDVQQAGMLEAVFDGACQTWGRLDIALHSIAFAPKEDLRGGC